jgi:hypothetical protein
MEALHYQESETCHQVFEMALKGPVGEAARSQLKTCVHCPNATGLCSWQTVSVANGLLTTGEQGAIIRLPI